MKKTIIDRCEIVAVIFMLMYNPPIWKTKSLLVLAIVSCVYIILNYRYIIRLFGRVLQQYIVWIPLFIYLFVVALSNNNKPLSLQSFIYLLIAVIPTSIMLTALVYKKGYDFQYYLDSILYAGLLQCIISILAFFSPGLKNILVNMMIAGKVFQDGTYSSYIMNLRIFGFSTGLTFGMPALHAFLAVIAFYLATNNQKKSVKYYIMVPLFAFSGVINARTTVIIIGVGLIAYLICNYNMLGNAKRLLQFVVLSVAIVLIGFIGIVVLDTFSHATYVWFTEGLSQVLGFFSGDTTTGYFSYVTGSGKWIIPKDFNLITGFGIRVMGQNPIGPSTDVGYVNDIFFGGIIYSTIIYSCIVYYSYDVLLKYKGYYINGFNRFITLYFILSLIVLNFKGYIIDLNNFFVLFIMLTVFCSHGCRKKDAEIYTLIRY